MEDEPVEIPTVDTKAVPAPSVGERGSTAPADNKEDDGDDSLDYFQKLAADG